MIKKILQILELIEHNQRQIKIQLNDIQEEIEEIKELKISEIDLIQFYNKNK